MQIKLTKVQFIFFLLSAQLSFAEQGECVGAKGKNQVLKIKYQSRVYPDDSFDYRAWVTLNGEGPAVYDLKGSLNLSKGTANWFTQRAIIDFGDLVISFSPYRDRLEGRVGQLPFEKLRCSNVN